MEPIYQDVYNVPQDKNNPTFVVIYRGYLKPNLEDQYQEYWKIVASYFASKRGALGSTLHKCEDGMWIAYSRWPNEETRDASWPKDQDSINDAFPQEIRDAIIGLKACLDEERQLPEICMHIKEEIRNGQN